MKGFGEQDKSKKSPKGNSSKTELINKSIKFHIEGNIPEAIKGYKKFIDQGFKDHNVFSNYGLILRDLGRLKEAEYITRQAIALNPNFADAYSNLGVILRDLGQFKEAELTTRKAINLEPNFPDYHYNLGNILKDLKKLKEAELTTRKAIELNPNFSDARANLGIILRDLGRLEESKLSTLKAIELNPYNSSAYFDLTLLNYSFDEKKDLKNILFSENILNNNNKKGNVDTFFARANVFHKEKNFQKSEENLLLANKLKIDIHPSNYDLIIKRSQLLFSVSNKKKSNNIINKNDNLNIFIVGMPRSGSTLLESILSANNNVKDLGETNVLEESFLEWNKVNRKYNLSDIYLKRAIGNNKKIKITTNKWLYNYQLCRDNIQRNQKFKNYSLLPKPIR